MLKKILYTDSGADNNAQDMLKRLIELPALKDSEVSILRVVSSTSKEDVEESIQQAEAKIKELITRLGTGNKVISLVREGEPKTTVLNVAQEINADLIIMGSRGLGKLQSILSNSVSQYVFQLTDRPMLLVKDDIYVKRIKRVMVALDKSPAAQYALDLALYLLQGYQDAELFLTRVNPDLKADVTLSKQEMEQNPILAPAAAKAKRMGVNYRCLVTGGRPAQQIRDLAEDHNIDLLVIGSPERRPSIAKSLPDLDRLLGSSLSDFIRVKADCPVLLARNEEI